MQQKTLTPKTSITTQTILLQVMRLYRSILTSVIQISSFIRASIGATPKRFLAVNRCFNAFRAWNGVGSSGTSDDTEQNDWSAFSSRSCSVFSPPFLQTFDKILTSARCCSVNVTGVFLFFSDILSNKNQV